MSEEKGKASFADLNHTPWDYDSVSASRFTARTLRTVTSVGRILGDLPGGHDLAPSATLDRTTVVQLPVRFAEAAVVARAYAWTGAAPLLLCWRSLEDGSGMALPWVLDEEAAGVTAVDLEPDARVKTCRAVSYTHLTLPTKA